MLVGLRGALAIRVPRRAACANNADGLPDAKQTRVQPVIVGHHRQAWLAAAGTARKLMLAGAKATVPASAGNAFEGRQRIAVAERQHARRSA